MDSTAIKVCNIKRAYSNKVFNTIATKGKTTTGWFYGMNLNLIVNDLGEIINFSLTTGKANDRWPVENLCKNLMGKVFSDKGYLSKELFEKLMGKGIELITHIRKNIKNAFMPIWDKLMLRKRSMIETIIDQIKNISQIEYSRHRSIPNFMVNLIAGITAYELKEKNRLYPIYIQLVYNNSNPKLTLIGLKISKPNYMKSNQYGHYFTKSH